MFQQFYLYCLAHRSKSITYETLNLGYMLDAPICKPFYVNKNVFLKYKNNAGIFSRVQHEHFYIKRK